MTPPSNRTTRTSARPKPGAARQMRRRARAVFVSAMLGLAAWCLPLTSLAQTTAAPARSPSALPSPSPAQPGNASVLVSPLPPSGTQQTAPLAVQPPQQVAPSVPEGAIGPASSAPEVAAFDISVRTSPAFADVRALLETHLELQRYRAVTDLDDNELARLIVLSERNVRNLVGTLGYFSPTIRITRETASDTLRGQRPTIVVAVEPGEATLTTDVSLRFLGAIAESDAADVLAQRQDIERSWQLPAGQRFTQDRWDSAKTQALRLLTARRYPAGKLADSLADIDPANHSARLTATLESGPLYRLGNIAVTGVARYNPELVPRLARLTPGAVYDQRELVEAQQRMASSGYFDSAYVFVDPTPENGTVDPLAIPVQVQVREAKLQKVILGAGVTTDSGLRASLEHSHNRVPGTDWRAVTKLQLEKKSPFAQTEWTALPDEANWRWVALARAERLDDGALITQGQQLRFGRRQSGARIDRNVYLQYSRAQVHGAGALDSAGTGTGAGATLSANYIWTGRYFDSLPFPGSGYGLGLELGGGTTLSDKREPYLRTVGRWLGIHTLTQGRIAMRLEAGAVLARGSARIPATELFRTGGDSSVRGYGLRDIGIALASSPGTIGPGHYLGVGSVEWQRPIRGSNGLLTEWENTFFIDAGGVADRAKDVRPAVGVGTGVRWKSPIGPLQIDLAYGVKARQLRLHTSVGFVF